MRAFDLLARPGRPLGAGATAQVCAPPNIRPFSGTPQGGRPPATVLTSSGVLDAAVPSGMGDRRECCEFDEQSTMTSHVPFHPFLAKQDIWDVTWLPLFCDIFGIFG